MMNLVFNQLLLQAIVLQRCHLHLFVLMQMFLSKFVCGKHAIPFKKKIYIFMPILEIEPMKLLSASLFQNGSSINILI